MNWQQRLHNSLQRFTNEATLLKIMEGSDTIVDASSTVETAQWAKGAIERLMVAMDETTQKKVLTACACTFPRNDMEMMRKLYEETGDIDTLLEVMNKDRYWFQAAQREGSIIFLIKNPQDADGYRQAETTEEQRRHYCHCPMVRATEELIPMMYCYCGAGWFVQEWEGILGVPVLVEVLESVIAGGECCRFAVHLPEGLIE